MTYINTFGFKIYRLQKAQENCEFLLYDMDKDSYYQFSKNRFKDILKLKIEKILAKPLTTFMIDEQLIDSDSKSKNKEAYNIFESWITNEINIIDNINYKPIDKLIFEEEDNVYFNIYRKPNIYKEIYEGKFPNVEKVLLNLVDNDKEAYNYLNCWFAYKVQNPTKRLATSIIFQGEQGTGKTLLCNYVLRDIFGSNYCEINQSDLNKEYNDYIMGKEIIIANEVIYTNTKTATADRLKNYVTDKYVSINRKYKDSINITNYSQWIFTSNNQVPIKIERGDRRYTVFKSKKLPNGKNIFNNLFQDNSEVKAYLYYLLNLSVDFDLVNEPYMTNAKKDIIEATANSVESFFEEIENIGGIDKLNNHYQDTDTYNYKNFFEFIQNSKSTYIALDNLYILYKKFCVENGFKGIFGRNNFTSMLKHMNKELTVIKDINNKSVRAMKLGGLE